MKQLLLNQTLI